MSARLHGINVTAATRFKTRYVTRANPVTRYAQNGSIHCPRVKSTLATDTQALCIVISTYGKKNFGASGNPELRFHAWCTYPSASSTSPICLREPSARNCAHNLRARHMDIWLPAEMLQKRPMNIHAFVLSEKRETFRKETQKKDR